MSRIWIAATAAALVGGCTGGQMLVKGESAPAFPAGLRMIDGTEPSLPALTERGPLVLVLLRGCF